MIAPALTVTGLALVASQYGKKLDDAKPASFELNEAMYPAAVCIGAFFGSIAQGGLSTTSGKGLALGALAGLVAVRLTKDFRK